MKKKNQEKIILTDIDGVVLDFTQGFYSFLEDTQNIVIPHEQRANFAIYKQLGWTREQDQHVMTDYAHSDYFKKIPAKECARDVLQDMRKDGWRFIAITACLTGLERQCYKTTYQNRLDNLEAHFGNVFEDLHLSTWDGGKGEHLGRYDPAYWVDDRPHHALEGQKFGHQSFIMHTLDFDEKDNTAKLPVVHSWHEIRAHILKDE